MAREYSFDSFPYETSHYSILTTTNEIESEQEAISNDLNTPIKVSLITEVVDDAVYSLYYESEHCQLFCSLYGPLPIQRASVLPDKSTSNHSNIFYNIRYAPYCYKREWLNHRNSQTDIVLSRQLANTMDSAIFHDEINSVQWNVEVKVISHDAEKISFLDGSPQGFGMSILPAAINCTSILLTMAGIPLKGIVSSATVLYVEHLDESHIEPKVIYNPSGNVIKSYMSKKHCPDSKSTISTITFGLAAFINFSSIENRIVSAFTLIGKTDHKLMMKHLLDITWKIFLWQKSFIEDLSIKESTQTDQWL